MSKQIAIASTLVVFGAAGLLASTLAAESAGPASRIYDMTMSVGRANLVGRSALACRETYRFGRVTVGRTCETADAKTASAE